MKEVTKWSGLKPCRMEAASLHISALNDHPDTITNPRVARRAVDVVSLLSALQHLLCHGKRQTIAFLSIHQASVEVRIFMQLIPRNRILDLRTHRTTIRVEISTALREELRLIVHVLAATRHNQQRQRRSGKSNPPGCQSHLRINDPPPPRKPQGTAREKPASRPARTWGRPPRGTGKTCLSSHRS